MNEGFAIIISSVISVGGMALTQFFNYLQRKNDIVDRFYFESYQKRMDVYDNAINEMNRICEDGKVFERMTSNNDTSHDDTIYKKLLSDIHKLNILYSRLTLFGSPGSARFIVPLCRFGMELEVKTSSPYLN